MTMNTRSNFHATNILAPTLPLASQRFRKCSSLFIAQCLYTHQPLIISALATSSQPLLKAVCISDGHNEQPRLLHGDMLIHTGDRTGNATYVELQQQLDWLNALLHKHKVMIAGNHDLLLDQAFYMHNPRQTGPENDAMRRKALDWGSITYLDDSFATLEVRERWLRCYGSPATPQYGN
ncbi:hypothetical protein EJ02DRAFT_229833 [Clathrospora elynae]|uniref:Calcineurin-like phosphoesterase domain-containing protein n=1 Tax=Clathrospora elynae TaxID=706981 RepID=A0A6A5SLC2_9PLEO|nr:hypothetical protein EJ02DRAFT_229833 [Clathrospora elynae]